MGLRERSPVTWRAISRPSAMLRNMRGIVVALAVSALLGETGCSKSLERFPPLVTSCDQACVTGIRNGGTGSGGAGAGDAGDAGTGDGEIPPADASVTLSGSVGAFVDALFVSASTYPGAGTVTFYGGTTVSGAFSGGAYSVASVEARSDLWALLLSTPPATDVLPTLLSVDATRTSRDLAFARSSVLSGIYIGLLSPVTLDAGKAQLVLRFLTPAGVPLAGVKVSAAPGTVVAYDAGGSYSDAQLATDIRGMAILVNVAAAPLPGADLPIALSVAGLTQAAMVRAAQGAVTVADVIVAR